MIGEPDPGVGITIVGTSREDSDRAPGSRDAPMASPVRQKRPLPGCYFFSMFHSANDGVCRMPVMLVRSAVAVVNWPSGTCVG